MFNLVDNYKNIYFHENMQTLQNVKNNHENLDVVMINNSHFHNGTLRIKQPGIYKLEEDIIFHPNDNVNLSTNCDDFNNILDNLMPTDSQMNGSDPEYPSIPYRFGFFAAITVESDDVEIDLNGFTIKQSDLHYIQQRFFSLIELNASPFIKPQGPADFGDITFPSNVYIHNGKLGKSSHHSIHGNGNKNVLIENLIINDYEVGAIALNGSENVIIRNIDIPNSLKNVPINFFYSNALYTRKMLIKAFNKDPNGSLIVNGINKTIQEIICNLQREMIENVYLPVKEGNDITSEFFINNSLLPEGNIYGIVFNQIGVVVNDLSRIGRKMSDVVEFVDLVKKKQIEFHSIKEGINNVSNVGGLIINILSSINQFEVEMFLSCFIQLF